MMTFICFLNWTDQGAKNAKDAAKRSQAARAMVEKLGGRLLSAYVTTGHYDVVATVEMPDGEAMLKYATALSASGNARTTTVRAFTPDEFSKIAAEAPTNVGACKGAFVARAARRLHGAGEDRVRLGRAPALPSGKVAKRELKRLFVEQTMRGARCQKRSCKHEPIACSLTQQWRNQVFNLNDDQKRSVATARSRRDWAGTKRRPQEIGCKIACHVPEVE
jgi:uncharacterized protein with GYD domain